MNKVKRITAVLLAVLLLISAIPFTVSAAEIKSESVGASSGITGDCTWTLDNNGKLTISGNGAMADYGLDMDDPNYQGEPPWGSRVTRVFIGNL